MSSLHKVHVRNGEDCVEEVEETLLRASAGLSSLTDKVIMEYLQYLHPSVAGFPVHLRNLQLQGEEV